MNELLYFMLLAGIVFLMMRFGCGAHMMGHGKAKHSEGAPKEQAGTEELRWAPPSVHDGQVYYFCSRDCRERFEAAPAQYLVIDDTKHLNRNNRA